MRKYTARDPQNPDSTSQESASRWKTAGAECLHCGGSVMTLTGDRDDCRCLQCGRAPWQVKKKLSTKPGPEARASSRLGASSQERR